MSPSKRFIELCTATASTPVVKEFQSGVSGYEIPELLKVPDTSRLMEQMLSAKDQLVQLAPSSEQSAGKAGIIGIMLREQARSKTIRFMFSGMEDQPVGKL